MKIVFMGTPEFAVPSLKILLENNYDVAAVVTVPDKKKGRGLQLSQSAVKQFALKNKLEVLQPETLNDTNFHERILSIKPDLIIVVAFRILPPSIFNIPKSGSINLHASLLPKYRGAAPINWALIKGEKETGVTTFFLKEKVDTGNIILQEKIKIEDTDNAGTLHDKLSELGAGTVLKTVQLIRKNDVELKSQDDSLASKAPKIFKEDCVISWKNEASSIHNFIRGLSPYPGAFSNLKGRKIKILRSKLTKIPSGDSPGRVIVEKQQLFVETADNLLELIEIQPEGKRVMSAADFVNGLDGGEKLYFG